MDYSPPGSSVHGILQTRILQWVAMLSSGGSSWSRDRTRVSCIAGRFFTIWATREALNATNTLSALLLSLANIIRFWIPLSVTWGTFAHSQFCFPASCQLISPHPLPYTVEMYTDHHCFICGWILRGGKQQTTEQLSLVKCQNYNSFFMSPWSASSGPWKENFTWTVFPAASYLKLCQNVWSISYSGHIFSPVQYSFGEKTHLVLFYKCLQLLASSTSVWPYTSVCVILILESCLNPLLVWIRCFGLLWSSWVPRCLCFTHSVLDMAPGSGHAVLRSPFFRALTPRASDLPA